MNSAIHQWAWSKLLEIAGPRSAASKLQLSTVVLVAHPDDETIGAATLMQRLHRPLVVYLTDGAPHDRRLWSPDARGSRDDYAQLRKNEAIGALAMAGVPRQRTLWLGAADQEGIIEAGRLTRAFRKVLQWSSPDLVITHAYEGGHPDHDSTALIARTSVDSLAASGGVCPLLLEFPLYHNERGQTATCQFLQKGQNGDANPETLTIEPSQAELRIKAEMAATHHSQRAVLESFPLTAETFRIAPRYDFREPPHPGPLWYERMGWEMTGDSWRRMATLLMSSWPESLCA